MRTPHFGALFGFLLLAGCRADVAYDPVAVAGDDDLVIVGDAGTLDGSGSFDADGELASYDWTLLVAPEGSTVEVLADGAVARLTPDVVGTWTFGLTVTDDEGNTSLMDVASIHAAAGNQPPVAELFATGAVGVGAQTLLDAGSSFDPEGADLAYTFEVVVAPSSASPQLDQDPVSPLGRFTPDVEGFYILGVTVDDGAVRSTRADVELLVTTEVNRAPLADCGAPVVVEPGESATLDGRASGDPDGDPLAFSWIITDAPVGSATTFDDDSSPTPTLVTDAEGVWYAELTVSDGSLQSEPCTTTVSAGDSPENNAPLADAGDDLSEELGAEVTVDGSGSYDPDGDLLAIQWTFVSLPTDSALDDGSLVPDGLAASFAPDAEGFYVLQLQVCDQEPLCDTDSVTVRVTDPDNTAPIADAGPDQAPALGDTVTLDGSGSADPDGDPLTFSWSVTSAPATSSISDADLADPTAVTTTFQPDAEGAYIIDLDVCDASLCDGDTVVIDVGGSLNQAPVADAGGNQSVTLGAAVALDGAGSVDPDGDAITWLWTFASVPAGSALTATDIAGATTAAAAFTPDVAGDYTVTLVVDDGSLNDSDAAVVTVTGVVNGAPSANAGADLSVSVGATATLDGSGSSDPDGDPLSYRWVFWSVPSGSTLVNADIASRTTATPSFTPDVEGDYELRLRVDDGSDTNDDYVLVTATQANNAPVADAGADVSQCSYASVSLDGTGSYDDDGDSFTHRWVFWSVPSGSALIYTDIVDRKTSTPSFTPDVGGSYVLRLKVDDGSDASTDFVTVDIDTDDATVVLHLDETSGTTVTDDGRSALAVTTDNGDWQGAVFFGGLDFDGERLTVPDADEVDLSNDWTIDFWMKATPGNDDYQALFMKGSDSTAYSVFRYLDTDFYVYLAGGNNPTAAFITGANFDGDWHHYAITMDGSNVLTIYEDGVSLGSTTASAAVDTNGDDLTIGGFPSGSSYDFDGVLDEVIVRERALSSSEVGDLASATEQFCTGDSDSISPTISITTSSATTDLAYIAVEGTASDDSEVSSLTVGGVDAISTSGDFDTWVAFVPLSSGSNSVTASGEDYWGNTGSSSSVSFTYSDDCYDDYTLFFAFDDDGDGTATDYSPRGNDGTEDGADRVVGVYGNAAVFDGSASIEVADAGNLDLTARFTLDFWYASESTSDTEVIAYKGQSNTNYAVLVDGDDLWCLMVDGNGTEQLLVGEGLNDGDWHHVTCSWNLSNWRMFVDGVKEDDLAVTAAPSANTEDLVLGLDISSGESGYNGLLDGFRIQKGSSVALNGANALRTEGEACLPSSNLGSGATASASGSASVNYTPDRIIDGSTDEDDYSDETYWLLPQATTGYVELDLGDIYGVTMLRWANTHHGPRYNRATKDYEILISTTGAFAGEELSFTSGSAALETDLMFHQTDSSAPVAGQYIRFSVDTYHSLGGGLNELEVYGL